MERELYVIAHDIRSAHNIGALMRLCDGIGVSKLYITGYSPHPTTKDDNRLPHIHAKLSKQINKTALGAEDTLKWEYTKNPDSVIRLMKNQKIVVGALEQSKNAKLLPKSNIPNKFCLVLGREVDGVDPAILNLCDEIFEIPMLGKKESHNVTQAAAMALYHCRFIA